MTEPRTEAGRWLSARLEALDALDWTGALINWSPAILAIEAEAAAGPRDEGLRALADRWQQNADLVADGASAQWRAVGEAWGEAAAELRAALAKASESWR